MSMSDRKENEYTEPSKSQLKRDMHELQELGEALIILTPDQLQRLDLPEKLIDAITLAQRLRQHEAIRRQKQYIGKLMRQIDPEPIRKLLTDLQTHNQESVAVFHELERWRDRLINEGKDALTAYLSQHPHADAQQLRHAIKAAIDERAKGEHKVAAYRALFQFLKGVQHSEQEEQGEHE